MVNEPIPLLVLTGFLGAGKTTFLSRCLAAPAFSDAAAVVGEPGDAEFDAYLIDAAGGTVTASLDEVHAPRAILETHGLADPAPILEDIASRERFRLQGVVAVVDALEPPASLGARHASRAQAAVADAFVIAKTDLASREAIDRVVAALGKLNPDAEIILSPATLSDATDIWDAAGAAPGREVRRMQAAVGAGPADDTLHAFTVRFTTPVELSGFNARLAALLERHAGQVLRVKGLVKVEGRRGPAVIQAAAGRLYPVRTLKRWPAGVSTSALLVVARDLGEKEVGSLIAEACDGG